MFSLPPFPPGVNYMYMGLVKRGLAAMCGFFFLIFAGVNGAGLLAWLSIPVLMLTCFFDGLAIHRRWKFGDVPRDGIDDIINFVQRNKRGLVCLLVLLVAVNMLGRVISVIASIFSSLFPLIIIVGGLYLIFRKPKKE